jgi:carbonic anhydrase
MTTRRAAPIAVGLALASCSNGDPSPGSDEGATVASVAASAEWTYEGDTGPERWGSLRAEYATCATGTRQSPVDLAGTVEDDVADIVFAYRETPLAIFNNGHTIEVEIEDGSAIEVAGGTYEAAQFHFHAGSEHAIDGERYPLEMHIVHRSAAGDLTVVGLMVAIGAPNGALAPVFDHIPPEVSTGPEVVAGATIDLAAVLPDVRTSYGYDGSLTTPPCTEGVAWYVLTSPIEISEEQLARFTDVVDGNARPLQPLGDRIVTEDVAEGS